jgi:hypothetical protein
LYVALKGAVGQQAAGDVIEPEALADLMKFLGCFHSISPGVDSATLICPAMIGLD